MKRIFNPILLSLLLAALPAFSQMPGAGDQMPGSDPVLLRLLGNNKTFSAEVEVSSGDLKKNGMPSMTMTMVMSQGRTRAEMDLGQLLGGQLPPAVAAKMKAAGMDKLVFIVLPEKKMSYAVLPNVHAYAEMPLSQGTNVEDGKNFKLEKTSLGKETIDGHPCEKNKVVVMDDKGVSHDFVIWNATDLKDFPVRMDETKKGDVEVDIYKNVKLEKPAETLFAVPAGMTKYDSLQEIMSTQMMKAMGGAPK